MVEVSTSTQLTTFYEHTVKFYYKYDLIALTEQTTTHQKRQSDHRGFILRLHYLAHTRHHSALLCYVDHQQGGRVTASTQAIKLIPVGPPAWFNQHHHQEEFYIFQFHQP